MEVPPDLTASSIEDPSIGTPDASGSASYTDLLKSESANGDQESSEVTRSTLVSSGASDAYLEVYESFPHAWRVVGKALSNLEIEVSDRNRSNGIYYILYENEQADEQSEKGFWASLLFWRDIEVQEREKQYRVKLEGSGETTKVFVLGAASKKQSQGTGLHLLRMMEKKINQK